MREYSVVLSFFCFWRQQWRRDDEIAVQSSVTHDSLKSAAPVRRTNAHPRRRRKTNDVPAARPHNAPTGARNAQQVSIGHTTARVNKSGSLNWKMSKREMDNEDDVQQRSPPAIPVGRGCLRGNNKSFFKSERRS